jgi:tetratricopeptide (TPR) repeat protein
MVNFLQKRRIERDSARFSELLSQGEVQAALQHYEDALADYGADVDKALRVAYHFHRWLARGEEEDVRAVELLPLGEDPHSQIARASHVIRRLRREAQLAHALRRRDPAALTAPHERADDKEAQVVEHLGLAVLEVHRLQKGRSVTAVAASVLRQLPSGRDLPSELWPVWNHLTLWGLWNRGRFAELLKNTSSLSHLPIEERGRFVQAAVNTWGQQAVTEGDRIEEAFVALAEARTLADKALVPHKQLPSMALRWAAEALRVGRGDLAVAWLTHDGVQEVLTDAAVPQWYPRFLLALGYLETGKVNQARQGLQAIITTQPETDVAPQARYLQALSLLAETQTWERSAEDESDAADVGLGAMWRKLRSELEDVATDLSAAPEAFAWRGHLLLGLIAYVDSNATPTLSQLERFSAAVEQVESPKAKRRLKTIEADLLTRARATDEAIEYVRRRAYAELRPLHDHVLTPLGDAIPALVRAAVTMTLWEGDPTYDPLPDLQRIPLPGGDDPTKQLVTACMDQVRAAATMAQLADLLARPRLPTAVRTPPLTSLDFDDETARMGARASAVIRLRQGLWERAMGQLPQAQEAASEEDSDLVQMDAYARFYGAWQTGNVAACAENAPNRYLSASGDWHTALDGRRLLMALEQGDGPAVLRFLRSEIGAAIPLERLLGAVGWLLRHNRAEPALTLCAMVEEGMTDEEQSTLAPWLPFLRGLGSAKAGQYTTAIDAFEALLASAQLPGVDRAMARQVQALARLFRLESELALALASQDTLATRWPSVRRSLSEQAATLQETPELRAYGDLITSLMTYLRADTLVDQTVITRLQRARQALRIRQGATFVEDVLGRLRWRREVLNDFWTGLQKGNLQRSRDIFLREIKPAFGDRVPSTIQLAMVTVDWDSGAYTTDQLLRRLDILRHEAPDIDAELIQQVADYIHEADRTRRFTELVRRKAYDEIVSFVERSEWAESMPVPVAIALLHALYRKKQHEQAKRFGRVITDTPRLAPWVRDYGYLILGYLLYDNDDYEEAADAFEKISTSELLGHHNTDKYWAAAHFARGLQYLEGDKKEQAFDSFRRSLTQRKTTVRNVSLSTLFTYFGLQNLEARKGNRARQAFTLLKESVEGLEPTRDVVQSSVLGEMGLLLCDGLLDGDGEKVPTGRDFARLVERVAQHEDVLSGEDQVLMAHALHRLAICQQFRHERRAPRRRRQDKGDLRDFVSDQIDALEALPPLRGGHDPVILVVKGLIHTLLKIRRDVDQALEHFTEAARLGLSTPRFSQLVRRLSEEKQQDLASRSLIVDLFDLYLLSGGLPPEWRESFARTSGVVELYRSSRGYAPEEVARGYVKSPAEIAEQRLGHLKKVIQASPLKGDDQIDDLLDDLMADLEKLKAVEAALMEGEQQVITTVAGRMAEESD